MERKENIRSAYRLTGGNSFYDGMITCSTLPGKAVCRLVWGMNKAECDEYLARALSGIPEDFSGKLLEVPVGTGILTMPLYQTLPRAEITCLDYSPDMMAQAREKAERLKLKNVAFQQGDVGALPYADDSFDVVLSLNGFHAFPDKEAAYRETLRVLKPGGTFCGCFYVKDEYPRTDWFILSMPKRPNVETLTEYYAKAMMTKPMRWFCRKSGKNKYTAKDIAGMKATAALKAADRNPYSWNMDFYEYPDGSGYEGRFTKCGICVLMKKLGLYDLTPALCHLDYTISEAGGATDFVREYTLASGGPYCDCGYKKKA